MNIAITYVITLVIFVVIDTVWLGTMADRIYRPLIGPMLADNFRMAPAVVFYCKLVVIDITWGVVVSAASSSLACLLALKLLK